MEARSQPLPQNDEVGAMTRLLLIASLLAAPCLIALHAVRFARVPEFFVWWLPLVLAAAAVAADFLSGIVHWLADTWGSEDIPVLGRRFLRPFRVHHVNPDDFLERDFINCNGDVALLTLPVLASSLLLPLDDGLSRWTALFLVALCAGILPTNQVHQWAHSLAPPRWVRPLQRAGILLDYEQHQRHHAPPYAMNYCITTGWCNRTLTAIGFFPALERLVTAVTGHSPRSEDRRFAALVANPEANPQAEPVASANTTTLKDAESLVEKNL